MKSILSFIIIISFTFAGCEDSPADWVPKTVDEDDSISSVQLNGTHLHVEAHGDPADPLVVLLHGGPGDDIEYMSKFWTDSSGLADQFYVVGYDQRGSGLSRRHDADQLSLDDMLSDLEAIIEEYQNNTISPILIGHSWGGMLATHYVNEHPEQVSALVLLEPGPLSDAMREKQNTPNLTSSEMISDWMWGRRILSLRDHETLDLYMMIGWESIHRAAEQEPAFSRIGGLVVQTFSTGDFATSDFDFTTNLEQFSAPTLFVMGEGQDLSADFQEEQIAFFPNTQTFVEEGAGHMDIVWSRFENTAPVIKNFLLTETR